MDKNLTTYLKRYKSVIPFNICDDVITECKTTLKVEKHSYSYQHGESHSFHNDLLVSADLSKHHHYIMNLIYEALKDYHISYQFPWNDKWAGYSPIRINIYDVGTEMREHCDHIHSLFPGKPAGIPILTILGCLNDEYEGGELIMWTDTKIDFRKGDILIFPSNFLYPHAVLPITAGTRYSFVSWAW